MDAYIHDVLREGDTVTILLSGCDFKCPSCNTPHLVEFQTGEQRLLREVTALIDESAPRTVLITGGEPLLQRQAILALTTHLRERHPETQIAIDTNASKTAVVEQLLDNRLVDEFIVDVKAPEAAFDRVTHASTFFTPAEEVSGAVRATLDLLYRRQDEVTLTFRTLIVPGLLYRKEDLLEIAAMLKGFDADWYLRPLNPEVTLDTRLQALSAPSLNFLENLRRLITEQYPNLRVKIEEPDSLGT